MSLTSLSFIGVYFPLLLVLYFNPFFRGNGFRKLLLLSASLCLYAFVEPGYVFLLVGLILINYLLVKASDYSGRWIFRIVAIVLDAGLLLLFKYINELLSFGQMRESFLHLAFPVGLSYFTFKAISFVADSSREKEGTLTDIALYISNFLTIVSGPLSTYENELPSIRNRQAVSFDQFYRGTERLIIGFGKKVLIADSLARLAETCFSAGQPGLVMAWAGAAAFSMQLLFDFSGYTDIALGTGLLFGFDLPENFNYPYMATSVSDFWKRWHMSLTRWFTKYIYIPLGGSRVKTVRRHLFNLLVVWMVTGIWHGSSLTFFVWAMIYFVLQALEKYTGLSELINKCHMGHIYTLLIVVLEWVIFRSESLAAAFSYIGSMFACSGNAVCSMDDLITIRYYLLPFILGVIFSTGIGSEIKAVLKRKAWSRCLYNLGLLLIFAICMIITIGQGYSAPLYAGF